MRESGSSRARELSLVTGIACASLVVAVGVIIIWAAVQRGGSLSLPLPIIFLLAAWVWFVYVALIAWPLPDPRSASGEVRPKGQRGRAAKLRSKTQQRRRAGAGFALWCMVAAAYLLLRPHARALEMDGPLLCFALAVLVPASVCTLYLVMRAAVARRVEHPQDNQGLS